MKTLIRSMAVFIVFVFAIVSLSACGAGTKDSGTVEKAADNSTADSTAPAPAQEEKKPEGPSWKQDTSPVTIDWFFNFSWYDKVWDTEKVELDKYITEKTGVTVNIMIPATDDGAKLSAMIAANEFPDVITTDLWTAQNDALVNGGHLYPLFELADQYAPEFKNMLPKSMVDFSKTKYKDFYFFVSDVYCPERMKPDDRRAVGNTIIVREDLMKQVGLTPEDFNTSDKFLESMKKVRDAKLKYKDLPVSTLYFGPNGGVGDALLYMLPSMFGARYLDASNNYSDLKLDPKHLDALLFANRLFREGLLTKENFTSERKQIEEKIASGTLFCLVAETADYRTPVQTLFSSDNAAKYIPLDAVTQDGTPPVYIQDMGGWSVTAVTKNAKKPDRIIRFLEYLYSDEGQMDTLVGIKDKHYIINADGKVQWSDEILKVKAENPDAMAKQYGLMTFWWLWDVLYKERHVYSQNSSPVDTMWNAIRYAQSKYSKTSNAFFNIDPDSSSELSTKLSEISQYWESQLTKIVLAKDEQTSISLYNAGVEQMKKMGLDEIIKYRDEKFNKNLKDYGIDPATIYTK